MKAKEWAVQFESSTDIPGTLRTFIQEIDHVAESRGATPLAYEGATREQRNKFAAVCRLTKRVAGPLFEAAMREFGKHLASRLEQARTSSHDDVRSTYPPGHPATKKREAKEERQRAMGGKRA